MYSREKLRQALALYAVTDRSWLDGRTLRESIKEALALYATPDCDWPEHSRSLLTCVEQAIAGGATFVQLREKGATCAATTQQAQELLAVCHAADVPLVVNDDVEAARHSGADGVHVGQSDMAVAQARAALGADAIIGVSASTVEEALAAQKAGADYLGVGAIFGTPTKRDASVIGVEGLAAICAAVDIPVVAIGGLNAQTIPALSGSNAAGVAVVSGIFAAADIRLATANLLAVTKETLCL